MGVGECAHAATSACAAGCGDGGSFTPEGFSFVGRASDKHGASDFPVRVAGRQRMPGDINIALRVCGDRTSPVEAVSVSDEVALGFESGAGVTEASVEKRGRGGAWSIGVYERRSKGRRTVAHSVPDDMDATIPADGELRAADRADGGSRVRLDVNLDWRGEFLAAGLAPDIKNVAAFRVAFEIDEMDDRSVVHG